MPTRSKYATLDARIISAVMARGKRTHRRIYQDKFVGLELSRVCYDTWGTARPVLTRRLQALKRRGMLRCATFDRWKPTEAAGVARAQGRI